MGRPADYWLSIAVYDEFRGVPVRKVVARRYIDLRSLPPEQQEIYVRLGSLFFQGRSWIKVVGHDPAGFEDHLSDADRAELERFSVLRREIGAAVIRLLDDEDTLDPLVRQTTFERLENMGFLETED